MQEINLRVPRNLIFGVGTFRQLGAVSREFGKKAFVILLNAPQRSEVEQETKSLLTTAGVDAVFHEAPATEPSIHDADEAATLCKNSGCDMVISIGGGSVMDLAKAAAFLQTNPGKARDYQMGEKTIQSDAVSHIAVSTTSGTGSEGTRVSVLVNKEEGVKKSVSHPALVPTVALLDPELTVPLSPKLTALTGLDALSHAVESFVSLGANPFTEACSLKAIELIGRSIRAAVRNGNDIEARGDMAMASYLAGISLNAGVGAAHILAQPLGATTGMSHSESIAAVLPHVIRMNISYSPDKYSLVRRALCGYTDGISAREDAYLCVQSFEQLWNDIGVTENLSNYGLTPAGFDAVLDSVSKSTAAIKTNPRPVDKTLLNEILTMAM